jgi:hypothetical protein
MKRRNPIRQFPTVCVRNCASSNRTSSYRQSYDGRESTVGVSSTGLRLWRERVDHSVDSSPCTLHHNVRNVLSGNRHVPGQWICGAKRHESQAAIDVRQKIESLSQRQGLCRRLRRIPPCSSAGATHSVWRKRRSALHAACHHPARHATSRVRRRHNAWFSLIP